MPIPLPSLDDLRQRARSYAAARITGFAPAARRSPLLTIIETPAALVWDLLRYLNWQFKQLFPETAEGQYLDLYGARYNLPRKQSSASAGAIVITANVGNSAVLNGALLQTADGSVEVQTQTAPIFQQPGTATSPVVSTTAGSAANLAAGTILYFVSAWAGIAATATVALAADGVSGLTGGLDVETDAAYAARIRQREQRIPQGGAPGDYQAWAELVPGVTRAWEYPRNRGTGTIDVSFVMDQRQNIVPLPADVAAVQASLDANRPVVGDSVAFANVADVQNVVLSNVIWSTGTSQATGQAAVTASLQALFLTATPGGATTGPGIDATHPAGQLRIEAISNAIAESPGIVSFDLVQPSADIVSAHGHLATFGSLSFQ